jgi:hypothetical protein
MGGVRIGHCDSMRTPGGRADRALPIWGYSIGLVWHCAVITAKRRNFRIICNAPVAQLDRVSGYEPEGREFESLQARQSFKISELR